MRWIINHTVEFEGTEAEMRQYCEQHYTPVTFCCVYDEQLGEDHGLGPDDIWNT